MSTCHELRNLAKSLNLRGYSTANKARLIEMLEDHERKVNGVKEHFETPAPESAPAESVPAAPAPVPAAPASEPLVKKPKTKSLWNKFLTDYCKENGCNLKVAMSKSEEYKAYKAKHTEKKEE